MFIRWASDNIDKVSDNIDKEGDATEGTRTTNGRVSKNAIKVISCMV